MKHAAIAASLALAAMVAGCGGRDSAQPSDGAAPSEARGDDMAELKRLLKERAAIPIRTETPDLALKTIWALQDIDGKIRCAGWRALANAQDPTIRAYEAVLLTRTEVEPKLFTGDVLKGRATRRCEVESYSREINDIKVETDTRAVAKVTIRNSTPVPPDALEPLDFMKEAREKGETYRYVFTKIDGGWRLEDVYITRLLIGEERRMNEFAGQAIYPYNTSGY